jgi:hypothetical protein
LIEGDTAAVDRNDSVRGRALRKLDGIRLTAVMAAAAAVLNGCDQNESGSWQASTATRVCVDSAGRRVEDGRCDQTTGHGGGVVYVSAGRRVPEVGSPVTDGSATPQAGVIYTDAAHSFSVARGGFGGTGGDGHGDGGGHGGGGGE